MGQPPPSKIAPTDKEQSMTITSIFKPFTIPKAALLDTRLAHDVFRRATSLLAAAAESNRVPDGPLEELRDFVVAEVRYHHDSEDRLVWPLLEAANPTATAALTGLSAEHQDLACGLELLARVTVGPGGD